MMCPDQDHTMKQIIRLCDALESSKSLGSPKGANTQRERGFFGPKNDDLRLH
jgi:hypothetical protein